MANQDASRDNNDVPTLLGVSSSDGTSTVKVYANPITHRLLVDLSGGGSGTVQTISIASANGFAGSSDGDPANPTLTLSTTITGILKGNGTAISAATAGTDYTALAFKTIAVSGQSDVVADTAADTLTLVGSGVTITTNAGTDTITFTVAAGGDVVGPASATDNAVARFDGTTGKLIQNSAVTIADTSGDITAGKYNGLTITASTGTFTLTNAKVLTVSNTLTFTGTDGSSVAFGTGGTVLYTTSAIPLTVGTTTIASGTTTRILYDNAGVLGEYTLTGTGTVVVMATSPTFTTGATTPQLLATANDSGALGASGTAFADLFLASGGVINWAANNANITHSTGILTVGAGELRITSANVGTNADSVPTLSSTSTFTSKTLTSPTIQTSPVLATATSLKFTVPSGDLTATGITTNEFNSGYSSTAIGDLVYLDSSATWQKADADASAATYSSLLGIALSVAASAAPVNVLLQGFVYAASPFPTFTIGAPIYMSATAGAVTQTAPVTTDSATRIIGYGVHADKMWFNPSNDWITHT